MKKRIKMSPPRQNNPEYNTLDKNVTLSTNEDTDLFF